MKMLAKAFSGNNFSPMKSVEAGCLSPQEVEGRGLSPQDVEGECLSPQEVEEEGLSPHEVEGVFFFSDIVFVST